MDTSRIDTIIQYSMVVASGQEDYRQRELGPIHFIKYVYLADLAYAKEHNGETYTGAPWRFHHFGPWTEIVFERVDPALHAIGAHRKAIPGVTEDFFRWKLSQNEIYIEHLAEQLEKKLGFIVALNVKKAVQEYGSDTYHLLNDVYLSHPVLLSAPGDSLDFTPTPKHAKKTENALQKQYPTAKQLKKLAQKRETIKTALAERLLHKKAVREAAKIKNVDQPSARYDEVFFEGLRVLDELAGDPIKEASVTCSISDTIWKSKARHDPDLS